MWLNDSVAEVPRINSESGCPVRLTDLTSWVRGAGLSPELSSSIEIEQRQLVHQTPLGVAEGATTALAMVGAAIDDIWFARTGRRQQIRIDPRHAEIGMGSTWLLKVDGELANNRFPLTQSPIEGSHKCSDGRDIYFLCVFPSLVNGSAEVLGCELTPEAVAAAVRRRQSDELENALTDRGLTGVIVRDYATWLQHPQGQALASQPVVHIERIGDAAPISLPNGHRPLSGLRVLDATRVIAGPTCTRTLAEFGANVLQVGSQAIPDLISSQADTAHGKRRAFLDLDVAEDVHRLQELCGEADVFVQSYRPGSFDRRGFGPEQLAKIRPGIIYVSESAYSHLGPWRSKRGFDGNVQAASGIMALRSEPLRFSDSDDAPIAMAINDYCTGYWGAYGVLAALRRRSEEGGSWHVRVSLGQTAMWFMRMGLIHNPDDAMSSRDARMLAKEFAEEAESDYGRLTRLRPALQMSETPPGWETRTVLPGVNTCSWD